MTQPPVGPGNPWWDQVPPEVQQQLLDEQAKNEMAADDYRHSILRFMSEASYDHLMTVRNMLHNMTMAHRPDLVSAFYEGQIGMELMKRFNICPSCGIDHEKELGVGHPSSQDGNSPETTDQPIEELSDAGKVYVNTYRDLTEADLSHMELYGLDDLRSDGTMPGPDGNPLPEGHLMGFICTRCQRMQWPSIEDRMKDPATPDGCSGCVQKAKWG